MKKIPFTKEQVEGWVAQYPTPFYIYDEVGIRRTVRELFSAFCGLQFTEYFAVKATPNPTILSILAEEGCGVDCSSMAELLLAERVGLQGERIMFSSNNTAPEEFVKARELGAIINLDDAGLLDELEHCAGLPEVLCFRYNPGGMGGNAIIGRPQDSKFGMTKEQIFAVAHLAYSKGVRRLGIHCMIASNSLEIEHFSTEARILFELVRELEEKGIPIEFVNFGGGIGIPYKPAEHAPSFTAIAHAIKQELLSSHVRICMELGRAITGPHGYLVTRVRHMKETYKKYVGVDATMANLMRPGMYGAYHHIAVLGNDNHATETYDVVGSLCENNDKFAIDRGLPKIHQGDLLVIHDAGAHGYAMGFNYNGKLRCAELLLRPQGVLLIRRAETIEDYFSTMIFPSLLKESLR
jgi:diaminopimelate decarboxylase